MIPRLQEAGEHRSRRIKEEAGAAAFDRKPADDAEPAAPVPPGRPAVRHRCRTALSVAPDQA